MPSEPARDFLDRSASVEATSGLDGYSADAMGAVARIRRLERLLDRTFAQIYGDVGLHKADVDIMWALRRANADHVLAPSELGRSLIMPRPTITKRLYALEDRALIARERTDNDRRALLVRLTSDGRQLLAEVMRRNVEAVNALFTGIDVDLGTLNGQLRTVLAAIERTDAEHGADGAG